MGEKILKLLQEEYPDIDFEASEELIDDGVLDSFTLMGIITVLSMEFNVVIPYEEINEANFNSIANMVKMIERLT